MKVADRIRNIIIVYRYLPFQVFSFENEHNFIFLACKLQSKNIPWIFKSYFTLLNIKAISLWIPANINLLRWAWKWRILILFDRLRALLFVYIHTSLLLLSQLILKFRLWRIIGLHYYIEQQAKLTCSTVSSVHIVCSIDVFGNFVIVSKLSRIEFPY